MPHVSLDLNTDCPTFDRLPMVIQQASSRWSALVLLLLLTPAMAALLVPIGLVAANAHGVQSVFVENPFAGVQVGLGAFIWLVLFGLPLRSLLARFGMRRRVEITAGAVAVHDHGFWRTRTWTADLSSFLGVAHVVRTTNAGARHELVFVHPQRKRNIALYAADRVSPELIARAAALLQRPVVPASVAFGFTAPSV